MQFGRLCLVLSANSSNGNWKIHVDAGGEIYNLQPLVFACCRKYIFLYKFRSGDNGIIVAFERGKEIYNCTLYSYCVQLNRIGIFLQFSCENVQRSNEIFDQ